MLLRYRIIPLEHLKINLNLKRSKNKIRFSIA